MHNPGTISVAAAAALLPQIPDGAEETDELLLWDDELADCDPEYLPKRLLTDFSIYNAEVSLAPWVHVMVLPGQTPLHRHPCHKPPRLHACRTVYRLKHSVVLSLSPVAVLQGFFASLELLPLWSGVDPDVELFASGIVKDDEGDWGMGGQPLELKHKRKQQQQEDSRKQKKEAEDSKGKAAAGSSSGAGGSSAAAAAGRSSAAAGGSSSGAGGSSAAAAGGSSSGAGGSSAAAAGGSSSGAGGSNAEEPAAAEAPAEAAADDVAEEEGPDPVAEGGMRLFLSQIREWVVEYSADMLFISIRTDAAWYKLCRSVDGIPDVLTASRYLQY